MYEAHLVIISSVLENSEDTRLHLDSEPIFLMLFSWGLKKVHHYKNKVFWGDFKKLYSSSTRKHGRDLSSFSKETDSVLVNVFSENYKIYFYNGIKNMKPTNKSNEARSNHHLITDILSITVLL